MYFFFLAVVPTASKGNQMGNEYMQKRAYLINHFVRYDKAVADLTQTMQPQIL